jgi:prephenate dehydrogenase
LVILATPVGTILHHLDVLKSCVSPHALITDVGSTKWQICERARAAFENGPLFLGGHPLAGRECSGFANADAKLFDGATYVLSPHAARDLQDPRVKAFERLIRAVGARPFIMDASEHDRAAAFLSHLPQLVATALASAIIEETLSDALPLRLAASGFRDMTRLAESPYSVWRDICQTNREKIEEAVEKLISKLRTLKRRLATPELEKEFEQARRLRRRLEKLGSR